MKRWQKITIGLLIVGAFGAAAYCELVLDLRIPRSGLKGNYSVGTSGSYSIEEARLRSLELAKVFGATARTLIGPGGILTTSVDGKVVHTEKMAGDFSGANGLFIVGSRAVRAAIFPFALNPNRDPKVDRYNVTAEVKAGLSGVQGAQKYLGFKDDDWELGACAKLPSTAIGWGPLGNWLGLQKAIACAIAWKGGRPSTMLVSVGAIEGNWWLSPFLQRLCRASARAALSMLVPADRTAPDYAACILVHRPGGSAHGQNITVHAYEIGDDRKFAWMAR